MKCASVPVWAVTDAGKWDDKKRTEKQKGRLTTGGKTPNEIVHPGMLWTW